MLISKKSPRPSDRFFTGAGADDPANFPLRRYMRLREDFGSLAAHSLLVALLVVLVWALGRAAAVAFRVHGKSLSPWYSRAVWMLIAIFTLSAVRVLYYRCRELRRIRREMRQLRASFRQAAGGDPAGGPGGQ